MDRALLINLLLVAFLVLLLIISSFQGKKQILVVQVVWEN